MNPQRRTQAQTLLALDLALTMLKTIERGGSYDASEYRANVQQIQTARESFVFLLSQQRVTA